MPDCADRSIRIGRVDEARPLEETGVATVGGNVRSSGRSQARRGLSLGAATLLALAAALGSATVTRAVIDPPSTLWSWDAPYTRSQTVSVAFIMHNITGMPARYRISNDPATGPGGILTNGTDVPIETTWTLADGADGPRTVYGQVQDVDGTWTDAPPLDFVLDRSGVTAIVIDADRGYLITPDGAHVVIDETATPITGAPVPSGGPGSPPLGFAIDGGGWVIRFGDTTDPLVAGVTYTFADSNNLVPGPFADITHLYGCSGAGSFTVREIQYATDGDLKTAAVDFNLCSGPQGSISGSIRYGAGLGYAAMGQSTSALFIPVSGMLDIGQTSAPYAVTLQNDGTAATTLGTAAIVGDVGDDFALVADSCSGTTLQIGDSCSLSVRAHPTLRSQRFARLEIADDTTRGKRSVMLSVTAFQPTTTTLEVIPAGTVAPTTALALVTIAPAPDTGVVRLDVDGAQASGPIDTVLTNPSRLEYRYTVPLNAGDHEFLAQFIGGPDYYLSSSAAPITVHVDPAITPPDVDPPVVTAPTNALIVGGSIGAQHITWYATDAGSGLFSVVVERSVDGGTFVSIATSSLQDLTTVLSSGHNYQFRVRATDVDGNTSAWSVGPRFSVKSFQETSHMIAFDSGWTRYLNQAYWGGAEERASKAEAKATFTFTGRGFAWIGAVGPTRGKAQVYVDGVLVATVELHAASTAGKRVVFTRDWATSAHHTVVIKVLGTSGHPRVDLDAFLTSS